MDRCDEYALFLKIDAAFRAGDADALRAALGDPPEFPNVPCGPEPTACGCLQNAIYHSPLRFIRTLLELGADPNYDDRDGFPSLIAALSSAQRGSPSERGDLYELLELLLSSGADPNQHGVNDEAPLHWLAASGDLRGIELLLARGADPELRTRIDDLESPLEAAERSGQTAAAALLREACVRKRDGRVEDRRSSNAGKRD
jgi:uncharacterized protein